MSYSINLGLPADAPEIADHLCRAGGGLMEYLLHDLVPDVEVEQLLAVNVAEEDTALSYQNAVVVEGDGKVEGLLLAYPYEEFNVSELMATFVPADRLDHVHALYEFRLDDSFYIHALSVDDSLAGKGVGRALLDLSYEIARDRGFNNVSLHVWKDNQRAMTLYKQNGFKEVQDIPIPRHERLPHDGGMCLLVKTLDD